MHGIRRGRIARLLHRACTTKLMNARNVRDSHADCSRVISSARHLGATHRNASGSAAAAAEIVLIAIEPKLRDRCF